MVASLTILRNASRAKSEDRAGKEKKRGQGHYKGGDHGLLLEVFAD
jgi:hypothetical protein